MISMGEVEDSVSGEITMSCSRDYHRLQQQQQIHAPPLVTVAKKKRNLAGMPDPEADVIALSAETLLAKNRFVCEVCGKGFQRDQNLQLHRRGHNLPWKLKQRDGNKEVMMRKRVYVCPEVSCVHHSPSRALGDLTGIKKHFCRKHGEKKWKCDRCSRRYAVLSDWKAHMKTCGTREYRCDCGTVFSRRDSFRTHRAFCDALAEESVRTNRTLVVNPAGKVASPPSQPQATPSAMGLSPGDSAGSPEKTEIPEIPMRQSPQSQTVTTSLTPPTAAVPSSTAAAVTSTATATATTTASVFASIFMSSATLPIEPTSLCLSPPQYLSANPSADSPLFPANQYNLVATPQLQPATSATALLQRAAQMGATGSNQSLLHGLGLTISSPLMLSPGDEADVKPDLTAGLRPGLHSGSPATLDLLGLGLHPTAATTGLSALLTSYGGGFSLGAAAEVAPATSYGEGRSSSQVRDGGFDDQKLKGSALH